MEFNGIHLIEFSVLGLSIIILVFLLSSKERIRLEKYCLKENTLKSLGILLSLNTGLRIGEICALKWENIDLKEKNIYVKKTLQRVYDTETNEIYKAYNGFTDDYDGERYKPITDDMYSKKTSGIIEK